MILSNTEYAPGYKVVKVHGLVEGNTVRARHLGRDIVAGLKSLIGGEIAEYSELLAESRQEAVSRMIERAEIYNANAILNVRFATSVIMNGATELLAYGTAVTLEDE